MRDEKQINKTPEFEILTAVTKKGTIIWDVTMHSYSIPSLTQLKSKKRKQISTHEYFLVLITLLQNLNLLQLYYMVPFT
jgi:hypothetical protein